jgi:UV DNA damage endonuclease
LKKYTSLQAKFAMTSHIDFGLCCINMTLRAQKPTVFVNRTCRLQTAIDKGLSYVQSLASQNTADCVKLIEWNYRNGINAYRLSSDMFPHFSNVSFPDYNYRLDFARENLFEIGAKAYEYRQRLSMHPGQYNQIGAEDPKIFQKTVLDLSCHAEILDTIEEDLDFDENRAIICIHGGGVYGDKESTINRWCENFTLLPENVRSRIAIENCEKCYSVEDCLRISKRLNIPVIFDLHHYQCYDKLHPEETQMPLEKALRKVFRTWRRRGLKPYCHISEQGTGRVGHHSDYISRIPECFRNITTPFTLDIEAKMKEKAIFRLMEED